MCPKNWRIGSEAKLAFWPEPLIVGTEIATSLGTLREIAR